MSDVKIKSHDGREFMAYIAKPQNLNEATPTPGLVLIQEIFGVNQVMRNLADDYAQQGYIVVCPDLFWRSEPGIQLTDQTDAEWQQAFDLFNAFNVDLGVEDLKSTLTYLRAQKACTGKVGTVGYCLGGKLAYLMATRSNADANASYYGVGLADLLEEADNITHPLLMHMPTKDEFTPPEDQEKIKARLADNEHVTVELYEGLGHAFCRIGGTHYDKTAATLANTRTADFLEAHLKNA